MGAPLNPVAKVLRIFMEGLVDGNDVYKWGNVFFVEYSATECTNDNAFDIAGNVDAAWATHMAPECPSPTTLTSVTVTDLTSPSAAEGVWLGSEPGTRGDDSIPANASLLISYPAGTRYKGGHPRQYLYVLGNADLDGAALWSSAATTEVQGHWQAFLDEVQVQVVNVLGGTATFGFVRYRGKYLPNSGAPHYYLDTPFFTAINPGTAVARQEMASQRRRIGRRKA